MPIYEPYTTTLVILVQRITFQVFYTKLTDLLEKKFLQLLKFFYFLIGYDKHIKYFKVYFQ